MKVLIVLSALVAVSMAGYLHGGVYAPQVYAAPHVYAPYGIASQYHAQDALGQYNYGYTDGLSAKGEVKTADGVTRGGYTYVDAEGKVQSVSYTADASNGFRVAATNLPKAPEAPVVGAPQPVQDTVEVAAAKSAHFAAIAQARGIPVGAPQPVQETPEVASARAAHAAAHAAASARTVVAPTIGYAHPGYYAYGPSGGFAYSSVAAAPAYATYRYAAPAAPVVLTAQGVPVDTPEVQAARAADAIAHIRAKAAFIG